MRLPASTRPSRLAWLAVLVGAGVSASILPPPGRSCRLVVPAVTAARTAAANALKRGDYPAAIRQLDHGLRTIGDRYIDQDAMDDSAMKLVFAQDEQRKGRLQRAAVIKQRVLAARAAMCGIG